MNLSPLRGAFVLVIVLVLTGCYPSKKAVRIEEAELVPSVRIQSPVKLVLTDATILIFPNGFDAQGGTIQGFAMEYSLGVSQPTSGRVSVPVERVAAATKYEWSANGGHVFASFLHGFFGSMMTPLSLYCLICPKCCFGSCPTVYTGDEQEYKLEAELFSQCIAKQLEEADRDLLTGPVKPGGRYPIRITNEALETHYLNTLKVKALSYPANRTLVLTGAGRPVLIGDLLEPDEVRTRRGADLRDVVSRADTRYYRSGDAAVAGMLNGDLFDWIDVTATLPPGRDSTTLILRLQNTLLSTVLLYDIVLGSQGLEALNWVDRMDTDTAYARQFRALYREFSGVRIQLSGENGRHVEYRVEDPGPLAWKDVAVPIPVGNTGTVQLRIRFVSDNMKIDRIAFSPDPPSSASVFEETLELLEVEDHEGRKREDVAAALEAVDDRYLMTSPGEWYHFEYAVPEHPGYATAILVESQGYYHEWIRGRWISDGATIPPFNLADPAGTLQLLAREWLENRSMIESRFFETRIPLRREQ
jgi:hypothetical protein